MSNHEIHFDAYTLLSILLRFTSLLEGGRGDKCLLAPLETLHPETDRRCVQLFRMSFRMMSLLVSVTFTPCVARCFLWCFFHADQIVGVVCSPKSAVR